MEDIKSRNLLAEYRAKCSRRVRSVKPKTKRQKATVQVPDYYRATENKGTPMLFGSHAPSTVNYCVCPWVVKMSFYHQNDIPLGVFLDSFCFDETYRCPSKKECSIPMRDHIRRFCLGDASVTLILQTLDPPVMNTDVNNNIFMWKFCNECKNMSTILPLSYNSWMLSFSMFLLLLLNETKLIRKHSGECGHSIHRDQLTCFAKGELVAFFKVSPIVYSSLVFPPSVIKMPPLSTASSRLSRDLKDLTVKGTNLFSQIHEKVVKLKTEGCLESFVSELLQDQKDDLDDYRLKVDLIMDKIGLVDDRNYLDTEASLASLASDIFKFYTKWEGELLQYQELKKKEEKFGKNDSKQRMSSGSTTGINQVSAAAGSAGNEKASEKLAQGFVAEDGMSRIWQSMTGPSGPNDYLLSSPFKATIHPSLLLHGRAVVVDESQPSSIIAFALAEPEYAKFLARTESEAANSAEMSMGSDSSNERQKHFECQFSDETSKFYVKVQFAHDFAKLRERVLVRNDETIDFISSLSECRHWASSGGKSGMTFYKTADDRFILKQMSGFENNSFQDFASHYFSYVASCQESGHRSLLAKILGVFTVGFRNSATNKSLKIDVLVIENLFYKRNIEESYDLKGSVRNRLVAADEKTDDRSARQVLMDENLLKVARERPFYIRRDKNPEFYSAIQRDTNFLTKHSMMDYSLLVGIDADTEDLVLGIIDYIRTFTWDKKLEMIIKSTGILGGRGKTPTIIYPKFYQKRFIEAMDTYFIQVPDYWYQFGTSASISSAEE